MLILQKSPSHAQLERSPQGMAMLRLGRKQLLSLLLEEMFHSPTSFHGKCKPGDRTRSLRAPDLYKL